MTKEVLLSIRGLQFAAEDENTLETITPATYYKKNDTNYLLFEEPMEGYHERTKNTIKWNERSVNLTKKGLINVHMVFEENKKSLTDYNTPYGNIMVGIDTRKVRVREEEAEIEINVEYGLEINYEHLADCKITMNVRSKENPGQFI